MKTFQIPVLIDVQCGALPEDAADTLIFSKMPVYLSAVIDDFVGIETHIERLAHHISILMSIVNCCTIT
jgi:hypothetical protein